MFARLPLDVFEDISEICAGLLKAKMVKFGQLGHIKKPHKNGKYAVVAKTRFL
jgi:hypothetical protein